MSDKLTDILSVVALVVIILAIFIVPYFAIVMPTNESRSKFPFGSVVEHKLSHESGYVVGHEMLKVSVKFYNAKTGIREPVWCSLFEIKLVDGDTTKPEKEP